MQSVTLSEKWKERLQQLPESGMGYQVVNIKMSNGTQRVTTVMNGEYMLAESDFPIDDIAEINIVQAFVSAKPWKKGAALIADG